MDVKCVCPVCGYPSAEKNETISNDLYLCPICGRYEIEKSGADLSEYNLNHLASYLAYNGFHDNDKENRFFTTKSKEICDEYIKSHELGSVTQYRPVRLDKDIVEIWYPKTFKEKIDLILLYIYSKIKYIGTPIKLRQDQMVSGFFIDRYEYKNGRQVEILSANINSSIEYMINCLLHMKYINYNMTWGNGIYLTPEGYERIDVIQRNTSSGRNALVAMEFSDRTKELREAIRKGITEAGYVAIFIDEVEHNDFITPELLKYIRDSRFVVADLTHLNNGAYFEEGYAMGLGKPVIQLCQKDQKLHFDIAQKNTILWNTEDEIPVRLKNRIEATID